ncbi:hypothetical protein QTP86_010540, partial [Hemibagrus guttatus]
MPHPGEEEGGECADRERRGKVGCELEEKERFWSELDEVMESIPMDLEKAYDRVPREELWYCMRKSGIAEKYVRVVQDMYERIRTVQASTG